MKTFTNYTAGPRGFNIEGVGTRWLEPGETAAIDTKTIVGAIPDLGKPGDAPSAAGEIEELQAKVDDLASQVETLNAEKADLAKQVEDLTKPAK